MPAFIRRKYTQLEHLEFYFHCYEYSKVQDVHLKQINYNGCFLIIQCYTQISGGNNFHVRFKGKEDAVAVWDNRVTIHAAVFDYTDFGKRHGWRITTQAERPVYDPESKSRKETLEKQESKD